MKKTTNTPTTRITNTPNSHLTHAWVPNTEKNLLELIRHGKSYKEAHELVAGNTYQVTDTCDDGAVLVEKDDYFTFLPPGTFELMPNPYDDTAPGEALGPRDLTVPITADNLPAIGDTVYFPDGIAVRLFLRGKKTLEGFFGRCARVDSFRDHQHRYSDNAEEVGGINAFAGVDFGDPADGACLCLPMSWLEIVKQPSKPTAPSRKPRVRRGRPAPRTPNCSRRK